MIKPPIRGAWSGRADRGLRYSLGVFTGSYVGLEDAAAFIRMWRPLLVPGLLQTEDYARALIEASIYDLSPTEVEKRVKARIARQTLLSRRDAPEVHAVIGEAALRQAVGGSTVMSEQLCKLEDMARKRSNVTIQVLPFSVGANIGLDGAFTHLEFPDSIDPAVSYIEDILGETYIENADGNRRIRLAFDRISRAALTPEESTALIVDMAKE